MDDFLKKVIKVSREPIAISPSRLRAVGFLASSLFFLALFILFPIVQSTLDAKSNYESIIFRIKRLEHLAAHKDEMISELYTLRGASASDSNFLPTESPSLSSANLQAIIKKTVTEAGGELTSTQVIPDHAEGDFIVITVKVRMNGDSPTLRKVLHSFEITIPYLFIDNLNIRPIRMPINPANKNQLVPDKLSIDFDVLGYMRARAD